MASAAVINQQQSLLLGTSSNRSVMFQPQSGNAAAAIDFSGAVGAFPATSVLSGNSAYTRYSGSSSSSKCNIRNCSILPPPQPPSYFDARRQQQQQQQQSQNNNNLSRQHRYIQQQQQQQQSSNSKMTPLFIDCSIEYDLPNIPHVPKDSAPILMIHPAYHQRRKLKSSGSNSNNPSSATKQQIKSNINNSSSHSSSSTNLVQFTPPKRQLQKNVAAGPLTPPEYGVPCQIPNCQCHSSQQQQAYLNLLRQQQQEVKMVTSNSNRKRGYGGEVVYSTRSSNEVAYNSNMQQQQQQQFSNVYQQHHVIGNEKGKNKKNVARKSTVIWGRKIKID